MHGGCWERDEEGEWEGEEEKGGGRIGEEGGERTMGRMRMGRRRMSGLRREGIWGGGGGGEVRMYRYGGERAGSRERGSTNMNIFCTK